MILAWDYGLFSMVYFVFRVVFASLAQATAQPRKSRDKVRF